MTLERLTILITSYGTNPDKWPQAERAVGRLTLEAHKDDLTDLLTEEAALDLLLTAEPRIKPPGALIASLMPPPIIAPRSIFNQLANLIFPGGKAWPASAAFACLCVGLVSGYTLSQSQPALTETEALLNDAFATDPLFAELEPNL